MKHNNDVSQCFIRIIFISFLRSRIQQDFEMFFGSMFTIFNGVIADNSSQILTHYGFAKIGYHNSMNFLINFTFNSVLSTFLRKNQNY